MMLYFGRFKKVYNEMPSLRVSDLSFPSVEDELLERRSEVLDMCRELLPKKWLRGDNKELVQLVILYLDGQNLPEEEEVPKIPGRIPDNMRLVGIGVIAMHSEAVFESGG